ncbi:MAG: cation transporter, partial [Candidatus Methanoglobus sp.]
MSSEYREIVAKIGGMSCAMCAKSVEETLKRLPGVYDAAVNLATEKARIVYDPSRIQLERIGEEIERIGYQFLGIEGSVEENELKSAKRNLIVGWISGIFLFSLKGVIYPEIQFLIASFAIAFAGAGICCVKLLLDNPFFFILQPLNILHQLLPLHFSPYMRVLPPCPLH